MGSWVRPRVKAPRGSIRLSDRDREILARVQAGKETRAEIAKAFGIREKTLQDRLELIADQRNISALPAPR